MLYIEYIFIELNYKKPDDRLELDADKVTDHHNCELGRWIISPGFNKHRNGNDGLKLESIHEKLHSEIKNIIESRNSLSRERLEEMFTSLLEISNEVLEILVRINLNNIFWLKKYFI